MANADVDSQALGIRFTERMRGFFSDRELDDFRAAAAEGEQRNSICQFTLLVEAENLDEFLGDPKHAATLAGTVSCPLLDAEPLVVVDGRFSLLVDDPSAVNRKKISRW
ncbi:MAG: hypothetical protein AAGC79_18975 [Pseudomonadota bacterium]